MTTVVHDFGTPEDVADAVVAIYTHAENLGHDTPEIRVRGTIVVAEDWPHGPLTEYIEAGRNDVSLADAKAAAVRRLKAWWEDARWFVDSVTGLRLSTDDESRAAITSALSGLQRIVEASSVDDIHEDTPLPVSLAGVEGVDATITYADAKELVGRLLAYGIQVRTQAAAYRSQIEAASDVAECDAILPEVS